MRVERERAVQEDRKAAAAKAETDRTAWEQGQINQELAFRQTEDQQLAQLAQAGDTYALEAFTKDMLARRARVDAYYNATQAERKRVYEMQSAASAATKAEAATWQKSIEADFYSLPLPVRTELAGKTFHGDTVIEARAAYQDAVRKAVVAHERDKWNGDFETKVAAEVAKRTARGNLAEPALSISTGSPDTSGVVFMEDAEALFVQKAITADQMRQYRAQNLPYRAD
jgi:hypothetical protein